MKSGQPTVINDSVLANAVYQFLQEHDQPVQSQEIADAVLGIYNLPAGLADQMLKLIMEGDARFVRTDGKRWQLKKNRKSHLKIRDARYSVLDVEIAGHARSPKIIEIAVYRIDNLTITDEFCTFINPGRAILPRILVEFSGQLGPVITSEVLKDAPGFETIVPELFGFIGDSVLVAHNAHFDLRMINRELKRAGRQKLVNRTIDTLKISRKFVKGTDTQKLANLAWYFGIPVKELHLAREDARVLAQIFLKFIDILEENNIFNLEQLAPFLIEP